MLIGQYTFRYVEPIRLKMNARGTALTYRPQKRYPSRNHRRLHRHGGGSFCKFRINPSDGLSGVYAIVVAKRPRYIGECSDLKTRFNKGYGTISPRNCYERGQPTNCRINKLILDAIKRGQKVSLWFHKSMKRQRKVIEQKLICRTRPPWNC